MRIILKSGCFGGDDLEGGWLGSFMALWEKFSGSRGFIGTQIFHKYYTNIFHFIANNIRNISIFWVFSPYFKKVPVRQKMFMNIFDALKHNMLACKQYHFCYNLLLYSDKYRVFFLTGPTQKVLSVRLHRKSHQKSSKCQNLLTGKNLWFLG